MRKATQPDARFDPPPSIAQLAKVDLHVAPMAPSGSAMKMGDAAPGAITAALYLAECVGDIPWAHIDICGPMQVTADESWRPKGATGFGARLLAELAVNFTPPNG